MTEKRRLWYWKPTTASAILYVCVRYAVNVTGWMPPEQQ
jgi:hypothetical protein